MRLAAVRALGQHRRRSGHRMAFLSGLAEKQRAAVAGRAGRSCLLHASATWRRVASDEATAILALTDWRVLDQRRNRPRGGRRWKAAATQSGDIGRDHSKVVRQRRRGLAAGGRSAPDFAARRGVGGPEPADRGTAGNQQCRADRSAGRAASTRTCCRSCMEMVRE